MINIATDSLISFSSAAKLIGPNDRGKPLNTSTIHRWAMSGVRTRDGKRVRLEYLRIGGRYLYTTMHAIQEFAAALTSQGQQAHTEVSSPAKRSRRIAAAEQECDRLGI